MPTFSIGSADFLAGSRKRPLPVGDATDAALSRKQTRRHCLAQCLCHDSEVERTPFLAYPLRRRP